MNDRQAMLRELRTLAAQYNKAVARVEELEDKRAALYLRAREMDPPITFRAIAEAFGITEAAVMQKVKRAGTEAAPLKVVNGRR